MAWEPLPPVSPDSAAAHTASLPVMAGGRSGVQLKGKWRKLDKRRNLVRHISQEGSKVQGVGATEY